MAGAVQSWGGSLLLSCVMCRAVRNRSTAECLRLSARGAESFPQTVALQVCITGHEEVTELWLEYLRARL